MLSRSLSASLLVCAFLLTACDRNKPGNPMPPQKPPTPKTEAALHKLMWQAPPSAARLRRV